MSYMSYWMFVIPEPGGGYTVVVPDLPGCASVGETLEEAVARGKEALLLWLETAQEYGDPVPPPSPLPEALAKLQGLLQE